MCLPRLLIADQDRARTVHRPARLDALSWSGRLPADGSGAYELVYSPSSSRGARAVARAAALDLACGDVDAVHPLSNAFTQLPNGFDAPNLTVGSRVTLAGALRDSNPSFMQRAALASAVVIDLSSGVAPPSFWISRARVSGTRDRARNGSWCAPRRRRHSHLTAVTSARGVARAVLRAAVRV